MALDEALMEAVRAGADPVLRFYRWSPRCLSLGRNQPAAERYDAERLRDRGVEVVRRPTGGRAVLHDRELTYSVIVPDGALGSPRTAYAAVNRALVAGLRRLGVEAHLQPRTRARAPAPSLAPCFREPAEGEVVVAGRKLIGSAQFREGGVMLQHGSLLFDDDQGEIAALLRDPAPDPEDAPAVLADFLSPLPAWEEVTAALAAGWREEVSGHLRPARPSADELDRARARTAHFADPAWTWRR
jgi:lipoate-protein ligase A